MKLLGKSEDEVEVRDGEELGASRFKPLFSLCAMALGTAPVPAGMVSIVERRAMIALEDVSSTSLRAAVRNVVESPPVAWEHPVAMDSQILRPTLPKDFGDPAHDGGPL
jgi:hypothetical protein